MKTNFLECLRKEASASPQMTENGAIGHERSKSPLVDMMFRVSSYRGKSEEEIYSDFLDAMAHDEKNAVKLLFLIGDIREGLGERRTFCSILRRLADSRPDLVEKILPLVPEYSRWDYLETFFGTKLEKKALESIQGQLRADLAVAAGGTHKPISLLAKWLPSVNTSSAETRAKARKVCSFLKWSEKKYRQTLSKLRKRLKVTEVYTSSNLWREIDYGKVPSKANLKYSAAFLRHDEERRRAYLDDLTDGKVKINSSVVFPHEIVQRVNALNYSRAKDKEAELQTLEEMWKSLPDTVHGAEDTVLTVVDSSGSMLSFLNLNGGKAVLEDVAEAIGIYFSERLSGAYKDKIVTFSSRPKYIDLSACRSLSEKLKHMKNFQENSNTDLYKVFELVLDTAKKNTLRQEELPSKILVISDMEFDCCTDLGDDPTLLAAIAKRYKEAGYALPGLVFWNICSRTMTVPMQENENGVVLVSGFSTSIMDMVMSSKLDPEEVLLSKLSSERYARVEQALGMEKSE